MPKSRRKPPRFLSLPRLLVPAVSGLVLALGGFGFVRFTQITLEKQKYFAPDSAHPWDGYAAGCLFLAMAAGACLLLSLRDPAPMRWRRGRGRSRARTVSRFKRQAKRGLGSGTIRRQ